MVLVLGQERDGLSDSAWQQGDMNVSIGGTGKVESLNVSVATGIFAGRLVASKPGLISVAWLQRYK
jgi:tRNA G18 (ribose-2'-O)-methylase SpoU